MFNVAMMFHVPSRECLNFDSAMRLSLSGSLCRLSITKTSLFKYTENFTT